MNRAHRHLLERSQRPDTRKFINRRSNPVYPSTRSQAPFLPTRCNPIGFEKNLLFSPQCYNTSSYFSLASLLFSARRVPKRKNTKEYQRGKKREKSERSKRKEETREREGEDSISRGSRYLSRPSWNRDANGDTMLQLQIDRLEHRNGTTRFTHAMVRGGSPREMAAMMGVQPVATNNWTSLNFIRRQTPLVNTHKSHAL